MEPVREKFARARLRCTRQRAALYQALCETKSHPTADELFHLLRERRQKMSLATVYNTLEAFSHAGLCRKLPTTGGSVRYDADVSDHLHVRCRRSGRFRDVPGDLGRKLLDNLPADVIREIESHMGVSIDAVQIQLIGTCGDDAGDDSAC